ncbi:hypothetical protein [Geodermatophilus sp. URMC 63]
MPGWVNPAIAVAAVASVVGVAGYGGCRLAVRTRPASGAHGRSPTDG